MARGNVTPYFLYHGHVLESKMVKRLSCCLWNKAFVVSRIYALTFWLNNVVLPQNDKKHFFKYSDFYARY
jgi:hypothetical protein